MLRLVNLFLLIYGLADGKVFDWFNGLNGFKSCFSPL